ncbi:hypothetical protein [Conexibacter sp. DBS9H8]|uniref:hypothetical protein n=1 Tax=Conexibacter sp. DBS9H8 TaxID=2937801 RepID=UPI00200F7190|nr:hypothetical protein [Conexibacter sp. DBS9H8]
MTLLAVPNVSEGRDEALIHAIATVMGRRATLLDVHTDADHNRSVFTLAGSAGEVSDALLEGAKVAVGHVDMTAHSGLHPCVGALDVAPIVYLSEADRGLAGAAALLTADRIAEACAVPVFLYGELTDGEVTRATLRRGGIAELGRRIDAGELWPDFGPPRPHPTAGATLVAARPPLVAFNYELAAPATLADARAIAAEIRRLPGVRALGLALSTGVVQVSTNLESPAVSSPARVLMAIEAFTPVAAAELVGLAPARFLEDLPSRLTVKHRCSLEERLPS